MRKIIFMGAVFLLLGIVAAVDAFTAEEKASFSIFITPSGTSESYCFEVAGNTIKYTKGQRHMSGQDDICYYIVKEEEVKKGKLNAALLQKINGAVKSLASCNKKFLDKNHVEGVSDAWVIKVGALQNGKNTSCYFFRGEEPQSIQNLIDDFSNLLKIKIVLRGFAKR